MIVEPHDWRQRGFLYRIIVYLGNGAAVAAIIVWLILITIALRILP